MIATITKVEIAEGGRTGHYRKLHAANWKYPQNLFDEGVLIEEGKTYEFTTEKVGKYTNIVGATEVEPLDDGKGYDSADNTKDTQIARAVALKAAVGISCAKIAVGVEVTISGITQLAEEFEKWLIR